ncbi:hypothetical protein [Candidatus Palauibacter polyketidifaciens]|uniref:hypothetical protein n=1 Tax=Candidatus Palauibacter polyketidifaciens TaxID=3056740 RepID=UPI0023A4B642|nr:hypothetical protein [Candidatus Palauibacter polyketidifaciens]MDE2720578.1 hypothetical protein [Candidatus Palauibacter polyketidifaciens]
MKDRPTVESLPATWRKRAKGLRRYGVETPATALERCAEELDATLVERDETTYSLVEASRESGYSADHLGRLVRDGKIPNAGRPGAPRIALKDLPRKAHAPAEPRLAEKRRSSEVSNAQIVQSIIDCIDSFQYHPQPSASSPVTSYSTLVYRRLRQFPHPLQFINIPCILLRVVLQ